VAVPVRIGPDTLFIGADESVVLRLEMATAAEQAIWSIEVTDSTGWRLSVSNRGTPPEEIIVPRSWLSPTRVQNVRLNVVQRYSGGQIPAEFQWTASLHTLIHWTILLPDDRE
jgi:hypothetical protein